MSHTFMVELKFYGREPGDAARFRRFIQRLGGEVLDDGTRPHGNVAMTIGIDQDDEEFVRMLRIVGRVWRPGSEPKR